MKSDSIERITNLLLCFKEAKTPLTLKQVTSLVDGYPSYDNLFNTCRQVFMRDKQVLRDFGFELKTVPVDTVEKFGYELEDHRSDLSNLILTVEESKLIAFALNMVKSGEFVTQYNDADIKGGNITPFKLLDVSSVVRLDSNIAQIYGAVRQKKKFIFKYSGKVREVLPLRVLFKNGAWYFIASEVPSGQIKFFKVDRISDSAISKFKLTKAELRLLDEKSIQTENLMFFTDMDSEKISIKCYVDETLADSIISEFGQDLILSHDSNRLKVEFEAVESEYFYSQILGFGDGIEIIEPEFVRDRLKKYLKDYIKSKSRSIKSNGKLNAGK